MPPLDEDSKKAVDTTAFLPLSDTGETTLPTAAATPRADEALECSGTPPWLAVVVVVVAKRTRKDAPEECRASYRHVLPLRCLFFSSFFFLCRPCRGGSLSLKEGPWVEPQRVVSKSEGRVSRRGDRARTPDAPLPLKEDETTSTARWIPTWPVPGEVWRVLLGLPASFLSSSVPASPFRGRHPFDFYSRPSRHFFFRFRPCGVLLLLLPPPSVGWWSSSSLPSLPHRFPSSCSHHPHHDGPQEKTKKTTRKKTEDEASRDWEGEARWTDQLPLP